MSEFKGCLSPQISASSLSSPSTTSSSLPRTPPSYQPPSSPQQSPLSQQTTTPQLTSPLFTSQSDTSKCMFSLTTHSRNHISNSVFGVTISFCDQQVQICQGFHLFKGIDKSRIIQYLTNIQNQQQKQQQQQREQQQSECRFCLDDSNRNMIVEIGKRNEQPIQQLSFCGIECFSRYLNEVGTNSAWESRVKLWKNHQN